MHESILLVRSFQMLKYFRRNISRRAASQSAAASVAAEIPETLTIPPPTNTDKPFSPKIEKLALEISKLTLIEVSELSTLLKRELNLPDAPVMPVGGFAAAQVAKDEEEEVAPQKVKSSFTVKLMKFDEKQKVALIKEVKNLLEGMNLVQAKKFVESAPTVVRSDIPKEEADKLKDAIEKVGGVVVVE